MQAHSGAAELGLTMTRPEDDYARLPVQEERLVVVVPPTHRLARRTRVDLAEPVPVFITYLTLRNDAGQVALGPDPYARDAAAAGSLALSE